MYNALPAGNTLFLGITFGSTGANNGNVSSEQIVTSSGVNVVQNFTYDAYNRLLTATENNSEGAQAWTRAYLMDAWGNRAVNPSGYILNADLTPTALSQFTNNQWVPGAGYQYDGGNQKATGSKNSPGTVANAFAYDAENRLVTANIANTGNVTYTYDGEGRRVQKMVGAALTNYVYDTDGQLVAEYSTAPPVASGTQYLFADHLGSTRLVVDATTVKRYDYLPFGEEIPSGMDGRGTDYGAQVVVPSALDVVNQKFTSKERDAETGLDYFGARYFSSAQGRWTSPDPLEHPSQSQLGEANFIADPQRWNKYGYAGNNPLKNIDSDGAEYFQIMEANGRIRDDITGRTYSAEANGKAAALTLGAIGTGIAVAAAPEVGLLALGRAAFNWILGNPQQVQETAAGIGEGLSGAPPGSLTSGFARLGTTTAESVERKLSTYLLNADHAVGGDKAQWFQQALGFTKDNMADLAKQIVFDPKRAVQTGVTEFGTKYNQTIAITGANGKTINVVAAWIRHPDNVVRLVTAVPAK